MIPKIPIQNLYYLLCYVWDVPDQRNKVKVDGEKCHSLENLLAIILLNICEHLLRRGLAQSYRYKLQEVEGIKGKLNMSSTLKSGRMRLGYTSCQVDEFSQDTLINQIVYNSLKRLATLKSIGKNIREDINKTIRKFPKISTILLNNNVFDQVRLVRNNRYYSLALHVCKLIFQSTLPKKGVAGLYEFIDFTEDEFKMNYLFERFLMNFCKQHCKEQFPQVHREYIHFQLTPFGMMFKRAGEALPIMETDVSLYNPQTGAKKILDAKYYQETLVSKYGAQEKVRREHLSQIISYVMNQENSDNPHTFDTSGTLVYPTVDEDFDFSYRYKDTNHMIHVTTINLNQDWDKIEARIKEIVEAK